MNDIKCPECEESYHPSWADNGVSIEKQGMCVECCINKKDKKGNNSFIKKLWKQK